MQHMPFTMELLTAEHENAKIQTFYHDLGMLTFVPRYNLPSGVNAVQLNSIKLT